MGKKYKQKQRVTEWYLFDEDQMAQMKKKYRGTISRQKQKRVLQDLINGMQVGLFEDLETR